MQKKQRSRRRLGGCVAILALLSLGCQGARLQTLHLPEPSLPTCLMEQPAKDGEAVGMYEFRAAWVATLQAKATSNPPDAIRQALVCASDVGKALREAVGTLRLNNRP